MEQEIINMVEDYHKKTNGKCGLSSVLIFSCFDDKNQVKTILNKLAKYNTIKVRKGINGLLVFKINNLNI